MPFQFKTLLSYFILGVSLCAPSVAQVVSIPGATTSESTLESLAQMAGLSIGPLPATGCSESAISPEKVNSLLSTLQEPARSNLYRVLDLSSPLWLMQLYVSTQGTGLCLPAQNKVLMFPGLVLTDSNARTDISQSIAQTLKSFGNSLPKLFSTK